LVISQIQEYIDEIYLFRTDLYTEDPITIPDISHEQSSILFNLGKLRLKVSLINLFLFAFGGNAS
jgi:hypothetical protein